ncbi:MAG TPA: alpha/beta fold hydrolase [Myxococcaceae bacterium]|jgi:proline iminopeptidase
MSSAHAALVLAWTLIVPHDSQGLHPRESRVPVRNAELYVREVGSGAAILVLHGGPDFDHRYLLPDLDRLSDGYRLVYYDQRGRGDSARVRPEDVSLASELADLDAVRQAFHLDRVVLLGHSWGTVLALEYAVRHPERVSRMILMNPAPASTAQYRRVRKERLEALGSDLDRMKAIRATDAFRRGDPDAVAAYYRIHFKPALARTEDLERVMTSFRTSFTPEGILAGRAIEDQLMKETWGSDSYDLLPRLGKVTVPTLVITGNHDFFPVSMAEEISRALPSSRLVTLPGCGHFTYLECPAEVRRAVDEFLGGKPTLSPPVRR